MYKGTGQKYKDTIYDAYLQSITKIYIDEVLLDNRYLLEFKKGGILFENAFELGSVPSQYIEMKIHKKSGIVNPKTIRIEYGIWINDTITLRELSLMTLRELQNTKLRRLIKNNGSFETIPIRSI